MIVNVETNDLWELYSGLNRICAQADEQCEKLFHKSAVYLERIDQEISASQQKISEKEVELAALMKEEDPPQSAIAKLRSEIAELNEHIQRLRRYAQQLEQCQSDLKNGQQVYNRSFQRGANTVNRYLTIVEGILGKKASSSSGPTGATATNNSAGRYGSMSFRGTTFRTDNSIFSVDQKDSKGRTNLTRMKKGLAPIGYDGMPVNLHHTTQTESGGIMEISGSKHQTHHGALHINYHSTPSGINRRTFNKLRKAYWKQRAKDFG